MIVYQAADRAATVIELHLHWVLKTVAVKEAFAHPMHSARHDWGAGKLTEQYVISADSVYTGLYCWAGRLHKLCVRFVVESGSGLGD